MAMDQRESVKHY